MFLPHALSALIAIALSTPSLTAYSSNAYTKGFAHKYEQAGTLQERISQAKESFDAVYNQLILKEHFPVSYNNNLIFDASLRGDVYENGLTVMGLIEWLEQQNDAHSIYLLKKCNKYYFLQLTRLLARLNVSKEKVALLHAYSQDLYQHSFKNNDGVFKPFRNSISKLFIMVCVISASNHGYEQRKETMVYVLDKFKREMLQINDELGRDGIDPVIIKMFVSELSIFVVREPIVKTNTVRNILIGGVIVVGAAAILYWYFGWYNKEKRDKDVESGWSFVREKCAYVASNTIQAFAQEAGKGILSGAQQHVFGERNPNFDSSKPASEQPGIPEWKIPPGLKPEHQESLKQSVKEGGSQLAGSIVDALTKGKPNPNKGKQMPGAAEGVLDTRDFVEPLLDEALKASLLNLLQEGGDKLIRGIAFGSPGTSQQQQAPAPAPAPAPEVPGANPQQQPEQSGAQAAAKPPLNPALEAVADHLQQGPAAAALKDAQEKIGEAARALPKNLKDGFGDVAYSFVSPAAWYAWWNGQPSAPTGAPQQPAPAPADGQQPA